MGENETVTKKNILEAGKNEFLEKGFRGASLRNIVKNAGVTTGAFYGYYKSKEELFDALVGEPSEKFMGKFVEAQNTFAELPPEVQPDHMGKISGDCIDWMTDYIYDNKDAFKLILCCSAGTKYENFVHDIVEIEVKATYDFIKVLKSTGHKIRNIDPQLIHIIASGMFSGFFEIVIHDMEYDRAVEYVKILKDFHTSGWKEIMEL